MRTRFSSCAKHVTYSVCCVEHPVATRQVDVVDNVLEIGHIQCMTCLGEAAGTGKAVVTEYHPDEV